MANIKPLARCAKWMGYGIQLRALMSMCIGEDREKKRQEMLNENSKIPKEKVVFLLKIFSKTMNHFIGVFESVLDAYEASNQCLKELELDTGSSHDCVFIEQVQYFEAKDGMD